VSQALSTTVAYASGWNHAYHEPKAPLSEAEARDRHERGERYAVLIGGREHPTVAVDVELAEDSIDVYFLQADGYATCRYTFVRDKAGDPFWLQQAYLATWDGGRQVTFDKTVIHPDGRMYAERGVVGATDMDVTETVLSQPKLDEAGLIEPEPGFGDYRSIARLERG
jgi:hypothetical protein